ncbi:MAG: DUF642 domain-containing protein [Isosphaeraceae bacterium]
MRQNITAFLMVACLFPNFSKAFSVDLIVNGSFENPNINEYWTTRQPTSGTILSPTPGLWVQFQAGNTEIQGWTVTQGNVDLARVEMRPFDGDQLIDLVGYDLGGIQQSFNTAPGTMYQLSFQYANNWINGPGTAQVDLFGLSTIFSDTISHSNSSGANMNWVNYTTNFVANSNSTTLRFKALTKSNSGGVVIDKVSVVQPVPEPSSFVLMVSAVLVAGCRKRLSRIFKG